MNSEKQKEKDHMTPEEKAVRYLALAGGKENIRAVTNCMTRVRLSLYHGGSADPAARKTEKIWVSVI